MNMQPVSSSNVAAVGYDDETKTLRVEFNNGSVYDYPNVGRDVFDGLISADSVGSYFNTTIRSFYSYNKVAG